MLEQYIFVWSGFIWLRKQANLFAEFRILFFYETADIRLLSVHTHYTSDLKNEVWVCRSSESWQSDDSLSDQLRTVESDTIFLGGGGGGD